MVKSPVPKAKSLEVGIVKRFFVAPLKRTDPVGVRFVPRFGVLN